MSIARAGLCGFLIAAMCTAGSWAAPVDVRPLVADHARSEARLRADLEYLVDVIGPRLTGTEALEQAEDWAANELQDAGADRVWREPWPLQTPWRRGPITARLIKPYAAPLNAVAWGWTPATDGPRRGPVVLLTSRTDADFERLYAGRLKGAWVMTFRPAEVADPTLPGGRQARMDPPAPTSVSKAEEGSYQRGLRARLVREGVAGILKDAGKEYALHTVAVTDSPARPYPLPALVLPHESYAQLARLLDRHAPVEIEASADNSFGPPAPQANVLAEIRGAETPDQVVLIAAHLDSWDLATGASDDGAGVVAAIEALRRLREAHIHPQRTIRVALFTGEEQGKLGSTAYVAAHGDALAGVQIILDLDNGSGPVTGVSLAGRGDLRAVWRRALAPLGRMHVNDKGEGDSDEAPFAVCGVPAFELDQAPEGYERLHHAEIDTFDHADFAGLAQASVTLAALAAEFADMPGRLAHTTPGPDCPESPFTAVSALHSPGLGAGAIGPAAKPRPSAYARSNTARRVGSARAVDVLVTAYVRQTNAEGPSPFP